MKNVGSVDKISRQALAAFAFVEDAYSKTGDIVAGLIPLFAPILVGKKGRQFEPRAFADEVEARYGIPMSPLVAEGLIEPLARANLLFRESEESHIYRVAAISTPVTAVDEASLERVLGDFSAFANESLAPLGFRQDEETLKRAFLARLTSAQFLSVLERKDRNYYKGNTLALKKVEEPDEPIELQSALDVLSAEFALRAMEKGGDAAELMIKIASGALIAEVVLTLQTPSSIDTFKNLSIYVDAPLLLDLMDLSSIELKDFAISLFDLIRKAGARLAVFSHTLEEMRGTIMGPLEALSRGDEPFGPLGSRIRLDASHAAYARNVLDSLESEMNSLGIEIEDAEKLKTDETLEWLSTSMEESLRNNVGPLHVGLERRIRDAASISSIMRLRRGDHPHSISQSGSILVTRNSAVSGYSKTLLVARRIITKDEVPPAVTDRTLAGYLWFVVGGNVGQITRQKLIANCSFVMSPRNDIVSKVRQYLTELGEEKVEIFSALLLDKRAQRCLVHKTLGFPAAVTLENADALLREVKEAVASDISARAAEREAEIVEAHQREREILVKERQELERRHDVAILELKHESLARLAEVERSINTRDSELASLNTQIAKSIQETNDDVDFRIGRASSSANYFRKMFAVAFVIVYLFAVWKSYDLSPDFGAWKEVIVVLVGLMGFWIVPEFVYRFFGNRLWMWYFKREAFRLGVTSSVCKFSMDAAKGRVTRVAD